MPTQKSFQPFQQCSSTLLSSVLATAEAVWLHLYSVLRGLISNAERKFQLDSCMFISTAAVLYWRGYIAASWGDYVEQYRVLARNLQCRYSLCATQGERGITAFPYLLGLVYNACLPSLDHHYINPQALPTLCSACISVQKCGKVAWGMGWGAAHMPQYCSHALQGTWEQEWVDKACSSVVVPGRQAL